MSLGLNRTARKARDANVEEMKRVFDRPTRFTLNALRIQPATKSSLVARLWFREFAGKGTPAAKYLLPQVHGGERPHKRFEARLMHMGMLPRGMYLVPASGAPLDRYGNVQRRIYTQILSQLQAQGDPQQNTTARSRRRNRRRRRAEFFWGNPGRSGWGVWERKRFAFGTAVRPVFLAVRNVRYLKRFAFFEVTEAAAQRHYVSEFTSAIEFAIATSRRR
jgi:hypothetical protein